MQARLRSSISRHRKLYIVAIAVMLIALSYAYRRCTHSALADNLYAGAIQVAITVIFIDTILDTDRRYRLNSVNAEPADAMRIALATCILKIMLHMGLEVENGLETVDYSTNELRKLKTSYFSSSKYDAYVDSLTTINPKTKKSLDKLVELLKNTNEMVGKGLKEVRPYPKPGLMALASDANIKSMVFGKLIDELYVKMPRALKKKHPKTSTSYKNAVSASNLVWKMAFIGQSASASSDGMINVVYEVIDIYLTLHKAASSNELYLDA
jgi:hypothetical protein